MMKNLFSVQGNADEDAKPPEKPMAITARPPERPMASTVEEVSGENEKWHIVEPEKKRQRVESEGMFSSDSC